MVIIVPKHPGLIQKMNSADAIKNVISPDNFADNFMTNKQTNKMTIGVSDSKKSVIIFNLSLLKA